MYNPPWWAKAKQWSEINEYFEKYFGGLHTEMIKLIEHIQKSGLSKRLFAYTSMDKLIISIYEDIDPLKESLHITFDLKENHWIFEYFGGPLYGQIEDKPEFYRVYNKEQGIEKLESFISKIGW